MSDSLDRFATIDSVEIIEGKLDNLTGKDELLRLKGDLDSKCRELTQAVETMSTKWSVKN